MPKPNIKKSAPRSDRAGQGSTTARGYGAAHQRKRRVWARRIASGEQVNCARCGWPIMAGMLWDLGHVDGSGKTLYAGAEHRRCNRATETHRVKGPRRKKRVYTFRRVSRAW
jgi:hypothetical protein